MMEFLLHFCMSFISACGVTYLFCKLADVKIKLNFKIIFVFLTGMIFLSFLKYFELSNISVASYFTFFPILFYALSKYNFRKVIIYALVIWLVGTIFDLSSMLIASGFCYIFRIDLDNYYDIFSVCLSLIMFLLFVILGKSSKARLILNKITKFLSDIQYSNFTIILFCIVIFSLALTIFLNLDKIHVDFLLFVIIVLSIFTFILMVRFKINEIENKKYLETLKENNDFYIKMDDENRIFKHNLMAKLSSIKSVSNKKAIALIDDYVIKTNKSLAYSKRIKMVPYGLNGIIYQKTYPYLEDINFKITNKIDFDVFNVLKPRRYNVMVEKLVVSLDNAIEASLNSKNKVVVINLYCDEENIYIEIKNSFAQNLDLDNLGTLNYSTKGKKRGLGLFSILRDNEATVKVKVVNNYFISLIIVRKQKGFSKK